VDREVGRVVATAGHPNDGSLNCEPGYPARGRFAPEHREYTRRVGAEYVWTGESLVVLSAEEVDEIHRQLEEAAAYPERRRPSDAEVVNVRPEYL
jgi:hypothetical protein